MWATQARPTANMTSSVTADHAQTLPFACSSSNVLAKHSTWSSEILDDEFGASNGQIVDYRTGNFANITSSVIADRAQTWPSICSSSEVLAKHRTCSPEVLDDEFGAPNGQIVDDKQTTSVV